MPPALLRGASGLPGVPGSHLEHKLGADVGGHDEDGVLEVHGAALRVRHAAVVQDLQGDGTGVSADGTGVSADVTGVSADVKRDVRRRTGMDATGIGIGGARLSSVGLLGNKLSN